MADRRVRIAKDKAELVKQLTSTSETEHPPFRSYAAAIGFAAAYGVAHDAWTPFQDHCRDPEPIRTEIFRNQNLYSLIELAALYRTSDAHVLADNDEAESERVVIFEAYANGGFELLASSCEGQVDALDAATLILVKNNTLPQ